MSDILEITKTPSKITTFKYVYVVPAKILKKEPVDDDDTGISIEPEILHDNCSYVPDYPNGRFLAFSNEEIPGLNLIDTDQKIIPPKTSLNTKLTDDLQQLEET